MRLQRQESRTTSKKTYDKWVITLSPQTVKRLCWKEGEELAIQNLKDGIIIFSASIKKKGKVTTYKIPETRSDKYSVEERFLKIYNNLPLSERSEIVVVLDGEGVTWQIAKNYIAHQTEIGKKILKKLEELGIV